ncbi:tyrosine-type recombinase/integrase [Leptospira fluminis]|nr:tyrosine-type recombinase/integrase [Leptospira fluminis]
MNKSLKLTGIPTYDTYILKCNENFRTAGMDEIKTWLESLKGRLRPSTIRMIKAGLKKSILATYENQANSAIFLAALDKSFSEIRLDRPDTKVYSEEILSKKEIEALVQNSSPRTGLIIQSLGNTGLRISELLSIRIQDCIEEGKFVYIRIIGKNRKERRVFLPTSLFRKIRRTFQGKFYLFETKNGKRITRNYAWKEIHRKGKEILNKNIHPHTFRHSFATNTILKKGKDIKAVSQYLGHSSTAITADMYLHSELRPGDLF